ncbi:hypothetical protein Nhal_1416 [Nitrosococcus halophilus Nc 4]|uniref:Flp/Fap pilin component n=1 Tax=Nitrosococcus halophilus (strain Nc4) TaxID=472759 RepID=D5C110_NITHN|nr:hypothetical protein [Nitrosococcus halophilus]ADE14567.1 hypothetical protein Nhal_1416 [Nitrosococcus halophilus Nc 4]
MSNLTQKIRSFLRDEEGLTMTEYAVAGGLIVVGGAAVFMALGGEIERVIGLVNAELAKVGGA